MQVTVASASILFGAALLAVPQGKAELGLPDLNVINAATLSPAYGCRSQEEFHRGYMDTALFLSEYSKARNSPDLLFNGACGSPDYFEGSTAGDDMSLIADLGKVPLQQVSASKVFNFRRIASDGLYSKFARQAPVKVRHTYAVLVNKSGLRGLFVFSVAAYKRNTRVDLRFAVKEYQVFNLQEQSAGFDWESGNRALGDPK